MHEQSEHRRIMVGLVEVGEPLPLKLEKLARRLNSLQSEFGFQVIDSITNEALGNPDVGDHSYNATSVFSKLSRFAGKSDCLIIGVTKVRVAAKPAGAKRFETDYFSISDFSQLAIISTHQSVTGFRGSTVNMDQYVRTH